MLAATMTFDPVGVVLIPALALLAASIWWVWREPRASGGIRVALALACVLIGLHPVGTIMTSVPQAAPIEVVLMMDRTTSMAAQDYADGQPRIAGAATDAMSLVDSLQGARIAVIEFDDDARIAVPFTTDLETVDGYLRTIGWRPAAKASGSDISIGVDLARATLEQAKSDRPNDARYVVYFGDGEQTAETPPASFEPLRSLVNGSLVLGYGSEVGGPMRTSPESSELVRIDGEVQMSHLDEKALRAIAEQLDGTYLHQGQNTELPSIVGAVNSTKAQELVPGREYYWLISIAAAVGLTALLMGAVTSMRSAREEL
jgi:Ca-activated chloride channel family protein